MDLERIVVLLAALACLSCVPGDVAQNDLRRTIEFETTEVTEADVTVSPDGEWLIFTILGHLFRVPVDGGRAEQLTFGPHYNVDPVYAPDGARIASLRIPQLILTPCCRRSGGLTNLVLHSTPRHARSSRSIRTRAERRWF